MADLTAVILTKNEEINIKPCIQSVQSVAKRIIVIDSFSDDKTVEYAKALGAEVYRNNFVDYATQFNWGLDHTGIQTRWVLRIDADERFSSELSDEVEKQCAEHSDDEVNGFVLRYKVFFMGKWLKYGGIYPFRKLCIFKYGIGRIERRKMDEHTALLSGASEELKNDALHYDFKNLNYWIQKHNWYATREVQDYLEGTNSADSEDLADRKITNKRKLKSDYYKLPRFFRAHLYFIYRYYFRLGFLDGEEGRIFHFLQAYWYRFLVDAKIYEHMKTGASCADAGDLKV